MLSVCRCNQCRLIKKATHIVPAAFDRSFSIGPPAVIDYRCDASQRCDLFIANSAQFGHSPTGSGLPANHEKKITMRGYPDKEVSQRLGVSTHSLYSWVKKYSTSSDADSKDDHAAENRRLKRELARITEERDILKKATVR